MNKFALIFPSITFTIIIKGSNYIWFNNKKYRQFLLIILAFDSRQLQTCRISFALGVCILKLCIEKEKEASA
jgi:hypothetical protein